jgi:hypothetical protein
VIFSFLIVMAVPLAAGMVAGVAIILAQCFAGDGPIEGPRVWVFSPKAGPEALGHLPERGERMRPGLVPAHPRCAPYHLPAPRE